jgi:hypothetical protein
MKQTIAGHIYLYNKIINTIGMIAMLMKFRYPPANPIMEKPSERV